MSEVAAATHLVERVETGITVLRLNRPESLNALTDESVAALSAELDALARDAGLPPPTTRLQCG